MRRIAATLGIAATLAVLLATVSFAAVASARPTPKHPVRGGRASSQPDQVIQWNQTLLQLLQTPGAQPATVHPTRSLAITQLAVYDAVNAIEGGNAPYLRGHPAPRAASPDAAAAAAAHTVLLALFPSQQAAIEAKYQDSLVPDRWRRARPPGHPRGDGRRRGHPRRTCQRRVCGHTPAVHSAGGPGRVSAHAAELPATHVHALGSGAAVRAPRR